VRFLFVYTHQTWPMHYFQAGILARAVMNAGHEVIWLNCNQMMPGCHVHWILPNVPPQSICADCVQRTGWLSTIGIEPTGIEVFLTSEDLLAANEAYSERDFAKLASWTDRGCPVGHLSTSSPASATRTLSLSDPAPALLEIMPQAVASGILMNRALGRLLESVHVDRIVLHLGRLIPDQIAQYHAKSREIDFYTYETGPVSETIRLIKNGTIYFNSFFREDWDRFRDAPLRPEQVQTAVGYLRMRRGDSPDSRLFHYSPPPTSRGAVYEQLNIPSDKKIISFFTSSEDENLTIAVHDDEWRPVYPSQWRVFTEAVEWVRDRKDWVLVVRIHPNEGKVKNHLGMVGTKSLAQFRAIVDSLDMPDNVRIVEPDSPVSSYTLMEMSQVGAVWQSTIGIEMSAIGRPVIVTENPPYRTAGFTFNVLSEGGLGSAVELAVSADLSTLRENALRAVRWVYHQDFRRAIEFPLLRDHGRWEKISLRFTLPGELVPRVWGCLDRINEYLINGVSPYPSEPAVDEIDWKYERDLAGGLLSWGQVEPARA
jgi:hypothetical protein